jgi:hypothetical protein
MSNGENEHTELVRAYLGDSPTHLAAYARWKIDGKVPFNWVAFFIGGWWFLYHRIVWVAVTLILFRILLVTMGLSWVRDLITLGIALYTGFRGNAMYYEKMDITLEGLNASDKDELLALAADKGKPWKWVILFFAADIVLSLYLLFKAFR